MECKNHPGVAAVQRCVGCAESFCSNCLVDVQGQQDSEVHQVPVGGRVVITEGEQGHLYSPLDQAGGLAPVAPLR